MMLLLRQRPQVAYGMEATWRGVQLMGYLDQDLHLELSEVAKGLAFSRLKDSLNDAAAKANAAGCLWHRSYMERRATDGLSRSRLTPRTK